MKRTYLNILVFVIILAFTLYEELSFRRYLFHKHIYIIADCLPNFLASMLLIFAVTIIKKQTNSREVLRSSIAIVAGLICYEIAQIWMPNMVFDIKDIIASIIGGALAYCIIRGINK
jgi:glycopeptide antibiotics resistance protein